MTLEEEVRTAYANLQGHQDRSMNYIRLIDEQKAQIERLKTRIAFLEEKESWQGKA